MWLTAFFAYEGCVTYVENHWKAYTLPVLIVALVVLLRLWLDTTQIPLRPFSLMTLGILASAYMGGFRAGILATVLSILSGYLLFFDGTLTFSETTQSVSFAIVGVAVSVVCGQMRKAMRVAQTRARFINRVVESSPDCVKVIDPNGRIVSMNERGQRMMGITDYKMQVLDKPWVSYWEGEHHFVALKALNDALAGKTTSFEGMCATMGGEEKWWEVILTPIVGERQKEQQILVISRDITARRESAMQLRESERLFRQMADAMPQMVWVTRPDGFHEYYNKRWYEFTGVPDGSTDGEAWNGMFHPDDQERAWARWRHSLETGEPYEIEYRLRRADGVYCWTLGRALPIYDDQGRITRWYGTCTEIEDQKRVEADLREARDAAQAANDAKTEFLANMSHELRTPMNAVVGLANILATMEVRPEKQKEYIKTLQLSAQSLMELINDLLDMAKIENATIELERIGFNLAELVEEVISIMSVKAKERTIELVVRYDPALRSNFIGDPLRLRQVILNLVSNAVKFTERGTVTVEVRPFAEGSEGMQRIAIEVIDTGIGIAPDKLKSIFNKFSQADTSITRKYGGTGLGLSICKTLVQLMGGTVDVVSTPGLGSKFTVLLPLPVAAEEAPIAERSLPAKELEDAGTGLRVLLAEDFKANVMVTTAMLEEFGYRWELAEDGSEAVEKFKARRFDLVLMDVQMPYMDGLSATRAIRALEHEEGRVPTPIIGVTAHSLKGDRQRCLDAGMDDYLSKPFTAHDLHEKIVAALRLATPA